MVRPRSTQLALVDAVIEMDERPEPLVGYSPWVITQCTLPYKKPADTARVWRRRNGKLGLTITAGTDPEDSSSVGLPYGPKSRLLLAHLCGQAVKTQSPVIDLGASLNGFMRTLGLASSGGRTGSRGPVGEQLRRLVRSTLEFNWDRSHPNFDRDRGGAMRFAKFWDIWFEREGNASHPVDGSCIILSDDFYREIVDHPIPLNLDALRILGGSALSMDLYAWFASRLYKLDYPTLVTWTQLAEQFGKGELPPPGRTRTLAVSEAKRNIKEQLGAVLAVYHRAKVEETDRGLMLHKSPPHVAGRGLHGLVRAQNAATRNARRLRAAVEDGQLTLPAPVP